MKIKRFILCQYCDDVRNELDGKISMIGIYAGGLILNGHPPVSIPKLWTVCHIGTPPDEPLKNVVMRVLHDDTELLKTDVPQGLIEDFTERLESNPERRGFSLTLAFQLPALDLKQDGSVRVFVDIDGETLEGNRLLIKISKNASTDEH